MIATDTDMMPADRLDAVRRFVADNVAIAAAKGHGHAVP